MRNVNDMKEKAWLVSISIGGNHGNASNKSSDKCHIKYLLFLSHLSNLNFLDRFLVKLPDTYISRKPSSESRNIPRGRADIMKLILFPQLCECRWNV